jgi:succinate dehydrogenase hydrophobic anchor subunit
MHQFKPGKGAGIWRWWSLIISGILPANLTNLSAYFTIFIEFLNYDKFFAKQQHVV